MGSLALDELPGWAGDLLDAARVGHLALVDDRDFPRSLPVTFALEGGFAYTAVDTKPKRVRPERLARLRYLRRRPACSLTADRYHEDWSLLAWVQLIGRAEVLDLGARPEAVDALRAKYPQYGERPPGGPLIRIMPERAVWWSAGEPR